MKNPGTHPHILVPIPINNFMLGQIENHRFCQGRNLDMLPCILDKKNAAYHFSMTLHQNTGLLHQLL